MSNRFDYIKYDEEAIQAQNHAKQECQSLERTIEVSIMDLRSKALALTNLEQCYMWIGKGIRNDQITRNKIAELQEGRSNS